MRSKEKANGRRIKPDISSDEMIMMVRHHGWTERKRKKKGESVNYRLCLCKQNSVEKDYYQAHTLEHFKSFLSKTRVPDEITLDHDDEEIHKCADWLINVCDALKKWLPTVHVHNKDVRKKLDKYGKQQQRIQKRRKKPYFT